MSAKPVISWTVVLTLIQQSARHFGTAGVRWDHPRCYDVTTPDSWQCVRVSCHCYCVSLHWRDQRLQVIYVTQLRRHAAPRYPSIIIIIIVSIVIVSVISTAMSSSGRSLRSRACDVIDQTGNVLRTRDMEFRVTSLLAGDVI